jgi:acetylornithine/N-succinyldiaminopimelate aminotransferase
MSTQNTIDIENKFSVSFGEKLPVSIDKGLGSKVWDENGKEYLDFTSGWAVTCLGHSHPAIIDAIVNQSGKIIHNPNSGLTHSPARAKLLLTLQNVLPSGMNKVFFTNSGAEANDAAMKLARKITGRKKIISTRMSFHGRTLATLSATGQSVQRDRFNVVVPFFEFVEYNSVCQLSECINSDTAAVILEPLQGEGGIIPATPAFLAAAQALCKAYGVLLIVDEIQTGFFRTGPAFLSQSMGIKPDFLTMAKGIAGGFPFGAVAVNNDIVSKIEIGDHGGTYNGNPLGCAIASSVIEFMLTSDIERGVEEKGKYCASTFNSWILKYPLQIKEMRGKGLLWALEFTNADAATFFHNTCLENGLILNQKHGKIIRFFPALTITKKELQDGFSIMENVLSML